MSRRAKEAPNPVDAWMPLWIGDYLADTQNLTTEQHGAYLLLLMAYWRNRGPLEDDDEAFAGITRLGVERWAVLRPRLAKLFRLEPGVWRHKRVDLEREAAEERSGKAHVRAVNAAAARWAREAAGAPAQDEPSKDPSNATSMPEALLEDCPSPSPSPSPAVELTAGAGKKKPARTPKPVIDAVPIILPSWLPAEVWDEWCAYRSTVKREAWTARAKQIALNVLTTCHDAGYKPKQVVDNAIQSGYTGLYRPKEQPNGSPPSRPAAPGSTPADRVLKRITDRAAGDSGEPDGD